LFIVPPSGLPILNKDIIVKSEPDFNHPFRTEWPVPVHAPCPPGAIRTLPCLVGKKSVQRPFPEKTANPLVSAEKRNILFQAKKNRFFIAKESDP
jgi:hypothetical protein